MAMDSQSGFMPLDQIGQGYANPPAQAQTGFSAPGLSPFWQRISQNPAFSSLFQGRGGPPANPPATQNFNYPASPPANPPATGTLAGYGVGPPANPPAFGGANAVPGIAGAPGSGGGGAPPNPPASSSMGASGGPLNYWGSQRQPTMGGGFNAAGFGGLGATGGQGPGARYWARLNNIGGA